MHFEVLNLLNLSSSLSDGVASVSSKPLKLLTFEELKQLQHIRVQLSNTSNILASFIYDGGENIEKTKA